MKKLSVTLATYNEDQFLDKCLNSVKEIADEIVIVDGTSTDKTRDIAQKHGAKIILRENLQNFHINKKIAIENATGEWILQMDADEQASPELVKEIKEKINSDPEENGFWIPRANFFLGRFLKKGGAYPDYTLRLYRRGKGNLPAKSVHEQAEVTGKIGYLKHDLLHYNNPTFAAYLDRRFNRYTDIMAKDIKGGFFTNVIWQPLFNPLQGFLSIYFRHLGFLDGFPGFVWALFSALHFPIAYFKSIDLKRNESSIH